MAHTPLALLLQAGNQAAGSIVPTWVTVVTALAAPTVAALALYFNNLGEANRLRTELEGQQQNERQLEERRERLNAYLRLVMAARILGRMKRIDPDEAGGRDDLSEALSEIQLVVHTEGVEQVAQELFDACIEARKKAAVAHENKVWPVDRESNVKEAFKKAEASRAGFLQAARKELDLPALE